MQALRNWPGMCPPSWPPPPLPPSLHIYCQAWPSTQQRGPVRCAGASHPQATCHQGGGPKGWVGGHHAEGLVGQLSAHVCMVHARVQGEQTALPSFTPMPPELMGPKGGRAPHRHTRRRVLTRAASMSPPTGEGKGGPLRSAGQCPGPRALSHVQCRVRSQVDFCFGGSRSGRAFQVSRSQNRQVPGLNPLNINMWTPSA